jgi:hypothetical protein
MLAEAKANAVLDELYGSGSPATLYFRLFTASPAADGTGGTEVTGGSYAPASLTNNNTNFPAASGAQKANATAIVWPTATALWGNVGWIVVADAPTGGNRLDWGALDAVRTINNGDAFSMAIGQFIVNE